MHFVWARDCTAQKDNGKARDNGEKFSSTIESRDNVTKNKQANKQKPTSR